MIFTDYYKGQKLTVAKCRFDIVASSGEYDLFESLLINKRGFNIGGLSFNLVTRPERWKSKNASLAISKGSQNITSLLRPDLSLNFALGDIANTFDGAIIVLNPDWKEAGITTIEIFIARGLKNDVNSLWNLLTDGEFDEELNHLRNKAVRKIIPIQ